MLRFVFVALLIATTASAAGNPKNSNVVKKVVQMLEDLYTKVESEGINEKKTYDKFARFCDETKTEKEEEVKSGADMEASLKATIKSSQQEKENQQDAITGTGGFMEKIGELEKQLAEGKAQRKKEKEDYEKANAETEKAIQGLDKAVEAMRASQPSALLQQPEVLQHVRAAVFLADSMGFGNSEQLQALQAPTQDFNFHSGGIIEMLEKLQADFREADMKADDEEGLANNDFVKAQNALTLALTSAKSNMETAKETKGAAMARKGAAEEDLVTTTKELEENTKYLKDLIKMCAEKKATFEQRDSSRNEELAALAEATKIVKESTAPKPVSSEDASESLIAESAFLVEHASKQKLVPVGDDLAAAEQEAEEIEEQSGIFSSPLAFWQRSRVRHIQFLQRSEHTKVRRTVPAAEPHFHGHREELVQFFKAKAMNLHSPRFLALAQQLSSKTRAKSDVFEEIKKMIADQITNLQNKAAESQDRKASCDKRIGESSRKRDEAAKEIRSLNAELTETSARRDKMAEQIVVLSKEIKLLDEEVEKTTKTRAEEAAEASAALQEAKDALEGIDGAMEVMKNFYKKAAKNKVEKDEKKSDLLQKSAGPADDAPDAGFKNGEADQGQQEASTGIIGMLEVVQSDFKRTIADTKANEKKAVKAHKKFIGEAEASKESKTTSKNTQSQFVADAEEKISESETLLNTQIGGLKTAVQALGVLAEECGPGVSYEERKAARAEEIKALQEAVELINAFITAQGLR